MIEIPIPALLVGLAAAAAGGSLVTYRLVIRRDDVGGYHSEWTDADRQALTQELAVERLDRSIWHRRAMRAERTNRDLVEQLTARRRRPIPMAPPRHMRRSPVPAYGISAAA